MANPKLPLPIIIIDMVGVLLLGLGLAERFGQLELVPPSLRFAQYDLVLMVLGGLMMLPVLIWTLKRALHAGRP
ncbi:hypothetical protein [Gallaecimonas sp. GXIMD4217]|uniref:hypothetical protein n=1 Tax=Gallaecimonas sp. GXIMD4217 TaxID=3131927 RepID=UPI00311AF2E1